MKLTDEAHIMNLSHGVNRVDRMNSTQLIVPELIAKNADGSWNEQLMKDIHKWNGFPERLGWIEVGVVPVRTHHSESDLSINMTATPVLVSFYNRSK